MDAFIPDEGESLKDDIFSDPAYRDYSELLHGTYIAALIRRSKSTPRAPQPKSSKSGGSKTKGKTETLPTPDAKASTLSHAAREAFREAQEEIKWVPIYTQGKTASDVAGGASDAWEIDTLERDFAAETPHEAIDDDFASGTPREAIDDDFEIHARP